MPRFIFHLDLNCVVFSVLQPEYPFCVLVCSLAGALKSLQITVSRTVESGMVIVVRRASPDGKDRFLSPRELFTRNENFRNV